MKKDKYIRLSKSVCAAMEQIDNKKDLTLADLAALVKLAAVAAELGFKEITESRLVSVAERISESKKATPEALEALADIASMALEI